MHCELQIHSPATVDIIGTSRGFPLNFFVSTDSPTCPKKVSHPWLAFFHVSPLVDLYKRKGRVLFRFHREHGLIPATFQTRKESSLSFPGASTAPNASPCSEDLLHTIPSAGMYDLPLGEFCTGLVRSAEAEKAVVTSIVRYSDLTHRFLVLAGRWDGQEFWIRLDRHPRARSMLRLSSSYQSAKDMVG